MRFKKFPKDFHKYNLGTRGVLGELFLCASAPRLPAGRRKIFAICVK
jgi:hypothetical protein